MARHAAATGRYGGGGGGGGGDDLAPVPIAITICGDGGCGKSSMTLRLVRSQWTSEYDPTIEDSYSVTRRIDGVTYHLALTDTAGQEEYRGMWASSNLGADAFLLVYDITSRDSLDALQYFNDLIDMEAETRLDNAMRARRAGLVEDRHHHHHAGSTSAAAAAAAAASAASAAAVAASAAAAATGRSSSVAAAAAAAGDERTIAPVKIVAGNKCDLQESRMVPAALGLDWARRRGCGFMETSARLEVNIEETFALLVRRVVDARRQAALAGSADHPDPAGLRMMNHHNTTKPLSPLPLTTRPLPSGGGGGGGRSSGEDSGGGGGGGGGGVGGHGYGRRGRHREKDGEGPARLRGPRIDGVGRGAEFWKTLRCW